MNQYDALYRWSDWKERIELGGGEERIKKQHAKGKYTARERIELLVDEESFVELQPFVVPRILQFGLTEEEAPCDGVVTGYATINGQGVYVFSQDFTVYGGALGEMHAMKIANIMDLAVKTGAPIVGLNDSGGARIQEGVASLDGYGHVFYRNAIYSGTVPQISVILGPCAGGAVYSPALTDFVIMVRKTSQMFITGPKVVQSVTGEKISSEALGGADVHATLSGNAHWVCDTEEEALALVQRLLSYLPSSFEEKPPIQVPVPPIDDEYSLLDVVPEESSKVYDARDVILRVIDEGSFLEAHEQFAKNIVVGFGRIEGMSVGFVANQPKYLAGGIDIHSADKAARFIRFCDCFNIPIVTFEDVTGFFPGVKEEHGGIIRHGAKILYAYSEATVPRITVVTRKAFGGAYVALNSKGIGADLVFAWPNAELAVMGAEGAANIIFAKEIKESANPEEMRRERMEEYRHLFSNPYAAAKLGIVDDIIHPDDTRNVLMKALKMLQNKKDNRPRKKHGNIPL